METLSRLWMEGRTASQIAEILGNGITRNAVIGKVHRLGLSSGENVTLRAEAIKSGPVALDSNVESAGQPLPEMASADESGDKDGDLTIANVKKKVAPRPPRASSVAISELTEDTCRWPVDDPNSTGFRYCGAPASGAAPYCASHSKLAYQPTKPVRRPPDRHALFPGMVLAATKT